VCVSWVSVCDEMYVYDEWTKFILPLLCLYEYIKECVRVNVWQFSEIGR